MKISAGGFCQCRCPRRIEVGNREKFHRWMFGRQPCAQRTDSACADDGDSEFFAFHL
jgi:hypothetical protein